MRFFLLRKGLVIAVVIILCGVSACASISHAQHQLFTASVMTPIPNLSRSVKGYFFNFDESSIDSLTVRHLPFILYTDPRGSRRAERIGVIGEQGKLIELQDSDSADCNVSAFRMLSHAGKTYVVVSDRNDELGLPQSSATPRIIRLFILDAGHGSPETTYVFRQIMKLAEEAPICKKNEVSERVDRFLLDISGVR